MTYEIDTNSQNTVLELEQNTVFINHNNKELIMGFRVYAVHKGKIGKRKENDELMQLLLLVAKKYRIVKKKTHSDKYVVLYSEKDNQWSKRKTMRFVAQGLYYLGDLWKRK